MIRRPTPERRPTRAPYASADLRVPRDPPGPWTFRMPRWSQLAPIEQRLAASEGATEAIEAAFGAVIGLAWADEEWALESDPTDGAAVFAELYEAGWSQSLIYGLAQSILTRSRAEIVTDREVRERTDFFGPPADLRDSRTSGSPTPTSETSSPSIA